MPASLLLQLMTKPCALREVDSRAPSAPVLSIDRASTLQLLPEPDLPDLGTRKEVGLLRKGFISRWSRPAADAEAAEHCRWIGLGVRRRGQPPLCPGLTRPFPSA